MQRNILLDEQGGFARKGDRVNALATYRKVHDLDMRIIALRKGSDS